MPNNFSVHGNAGTSIDGIASNSYWTNLWQCKNILSQFSLLWVFFNNVWYRVRFPVDFMPTNRQIRMVTINVSKFLEKMPQDSVVFEKWNFNYKGNTVNIVTDNKINLIWSKMNGAAFQSIPLSFQYHNHRNRNTHKQTFTNKDTKRKTELVKFVVIRLIYFRHA